MSEYRLKKIKGKPGDNIDGIPYYDKQTGDISHYIVLQRKVINEQVQRLPADLRECVPQEWEDVEIVE